MRESFDNDVWIVIALLQFAAILQWWVIAVEKRTGRLWMTPEAGLERTQDEMLFKKCWWSHVWFAVLWTVWINAVTIDSVLICIGYSDPNKSVIECILRIIRD